MMMGDDGPAARVVQRFEVFTGTGRRREWPPEVKAAIVAESCWGQESVSAVARRHGLDPSQLFAWRQQHRKELDAKGAPVAIGSVEPLCFVRHSSLL
jgi:transposase